MYIPQNLVSEMALVIARFDPVLPPDGCGRHYWHLTQLTVVTSVDQFLLNPTNSL